jgi:hypothetical protein
MFMGIVCNEFEFEIWLFYSTDFEFDPDIIGGVD